MALVFGDGLITCGFDRLFVVNWLKDWRFVVGGGLDRLLVVLESRLVVVLDGRLVVALLRLALFSSSLSNPLQ